LLIEVCCMKKKNLLTVIAMAVFFIASCDTLQNLMDDSPRNLDFIPETLKEGAAIEGVKAGSFSAEGGSGFLAYNLISVSGEQNDNDKFTLEGSLLKIKAPSLEGKTYRLHARVEDQKGQFIEDTFTLTVGPPDGTDTPGTDTPGTDTPGTDTPGTDTPGTDTPGTDTPGTDTPGTDTPGTDTPGTDTPGTDTPGTDTPGTDTPGTDTPGTDTPGTDTPGTDTPGTDTPRTDTPGTDTPGTDTPGTDTPGTEEPGDAGIAGIIEPWRGVWYSIYGGARLDGYRVGRWSEIKEVMGSKLALFPDFDPDNPRLHDKYEIQDDDYFFFYDDTVYGEDDNGEGGNNGWDDFITRYIGIVRTINIFNGDAGAGAVIIEYLEGCYPRWAMDVVFWPLPFFGIYYRVLSADSIQMANAVDLDALGAGKAYYTETATLQEAIDKNTAENSGKFVSWGVVIPQTRSK
jgi:hypothetical protein